LINKTLQVIIISQSQILLFFIICGPYVTV
jgi:hypothetical protein